MPLWNCWLPFLILPLSFFMSFLPSGSALSSAYPFLFISFIPTPISVLEKSRSRHQSNVVHEPSEVPTILTLATNYRWLILRLWPCCSPPSPRWLFLYSIPGYLVRETPRGMRGDGKTTGSPLLTTSGFSAFWAFTVYFWSFFYLYRI